MSYNIWKFENIHFAGNLIGDIYWNFYNDDVITVTSLVLRTQSARAVLPGSFLLQLASVEQHCELNEKSEQVQQANVFKRQTFTFRFSTYRPNSCKHLSRHTPVWPHERIDCCDCCISHWNNPATRFFLINNTFSTMRKLFTSNMYCCLAKYLLPYTGVDASPSQTEWHLR